MARFGGTILAPCRASRSDLQTRFVRFEIQIRNFRTRGGHHLPLKPTRLPLHSIFRKTFTNPSCVLRGCLSHGSNAAACDGPFHLEMRRRCRSMLVQHTAALFLPEHHPFLGCWLMWEILPGPHGAAPYKIKDPNL